MTEADNDIPTADLLECLRQRLEQQRAEVAEMFGALGGDVERLIEQVSRVPQTAAIEPAPQPVASVPPPRAERAIPPPGPLDFLDDTSDHGEPNDQGGFDLETVVFGPAIAASGSLAPQREELIRDLTNGDAGAMTLCGAIMLFRGATAERMPQLLKDIGEAWYAWAPHTADEDDDLRDALCRWLERTCAEAGVPNTIELVRPGDRFDVKRHHARQPGVEVTDVGGWVVLRDNGKVYTKANVTVK